MILVITDFAIQSDGQSSYNINTETESEEKIIVAGDFTALPPSMEAKVRFENIKLSKYTPYAQDMVAFNIADGRFDLSFDFHYKSTKEGDILRVDNGSFKLRSLQLDDPANGEKF